ncbi:NUDIX hydrolase [Ochrobactrum sp. POC9]|uniref:NUDIX domain-containing protein n=1 Tax=Ochrobactrum sp. POC9 TaxID=2203419 RepID=UPI002570C21F|nr:NUDIX hydrolase [Ochrobactrum sp. POC9]
MSEIKTLGSRQVYENRWMKVREDRIVYPDGSESIYGVVEKNDAAMIFAMDDEDGVYLVEQFRYPVGNRFWELPQGAWQEQADVDPLVLARGELREETGLTAADMVYLGETYEAYGFAVNKCHIFLATGLQMGKPSLDAEEPLSYRGSNRDDPSRRYQRCLYNRCLRAFEPERDYLKQPHGCSRPH